jgi:hypothetical protein
MKQYSNVKRQYNLTFRGVDDEYKPEIVLSIASGGTGYTYQPTLTITCNKTGIGATAECTLTGGYISSVRLTNKGYGYISGTLTVTINNGGGTGGSILAVFNYNKYSNSFKNTTLYKNSKRFKFNLNGVFNNKQLGNNAKVSIESIFVPSNNITATPTATFIRLIGTCDDIYDTELGNNNNPIILCTMETNKLYENNMSKNSKSYRVAPDFLRKGYIEFDLYLESLYDFTKDVIFDENNFMVSMLVYEDDFEESTDLITAPQVVEGQQYKLHSNFYPNYNNK